MPIFYKDRGRFEYKPDQEEGGSGIVHLVNRSSGRLSVKGDGGRVKSLVWDYYHKLRNGDIAIVYSRSCGLCVLSVDEGELRVAHFQGGRVQDVPPEIWARVCQQ
jgi:hypothetical protein